MPDNSKNFYNFCLQSPTDVENALRKLSKVRTQERFLFYVNSILEKLSDGKRTESEMIKNTIRFIDNNLILDFIKNPNDGLKFVGLSKQLVVTAAWIGIIHEPMPYDADDLRAMQNGTFKFYHDVPFAFTLGMIARGGKGEVELAEILLGFLHFQSDDPERNITLKWETAFLLAVLLQTVWRHFSSLSEEGRILLLNNYLFLAIVSGVPVRAILNDFISSSSPDIKKREDLVFGALTRTNKEEVPTKTGCTEWKQLVELVGNYSASLVGGPSGGLRLEEFLRSFYVNQPNRDVFRGWLREVLLVAFNLQD